jgi:uncharacterized protein (DUF362 family)
MKEEMSRREVLRWMALTATASLVACQKIDRSTAIVNPTGSPTLAPTNPAEPTETSQSVQPTPAQAYLAVARGDDPAAITEAALRALGGIERFVKNGYDVIIKPNICTDYNSFEYGATTNPIVVATLVRLALGAGAKRVRVMDSPFGGAAESAYVRSGIADAVQAAGGEMEVMNLNKFRMTPIPEGKSIKEWEIYRDVLTCDLLIDVPVAKHHGLAKITIGGKNLMGVITRRSALHADLAERIADLMTVVRPGLTVVDAVRTIMKNGPTGGSLDDVKINNTVIASHDIVAADSYATGLFQLAGADIPYIAAAAKRGLGKIDLGGLKIEEVNL